MDDADLATLRAEARLELTIARWAPSVTAQTDYMRAVYDDAA